VNIAHAIYPRRNDLSPVVRVLIDFFVAEAPVRLVVLKEHQKLRRRYSAIHRPFLARTMSHNPLNIAVSARIHWGTPEQAGVYQKDGYFLEHSVANLLLRHGALATMVPPLRDTQGFAHAESHACSYADYAVLCDGLVLQGGADMTPHHYGEAAQKPEWAGDAGRDEYELALIAAFCVAGKPILGICRGMQVLNVYFGGSLHQDIETDFGSGDIHRDGVHYEKPLHAVTFVPNSALARTYANVAAPQVNTIHHQCVKKLGTNLIVEARADDGIIEAFRHATLPILGVQWHPEFHDPTDAARLPSTPLMRDFLKTCAAVLAKTQGETALQV
jgi:putative glutamine amidotransferase